MITSIRAKPIKETEHGTLFQVLTFERLFNEVQGFIVDGELRGELRIDDGRQITAEQRKKVYAMLRDISDWMGDYCVEITKLIMKDDYRGKTGEKAFSLSDCSISTARRFINYLIDFALENGVPLMDAITDRTDDIDAAIYASLKHRKCIICGKDGEIHHWDAIGRGYDRRTFDDSELRKLCLCRIHHTKAHQIGREAFEELYHVYGIIFKD